MIKILAAVLAALTMVLGVHLMFAIALAVTAVALFAVVGKARETGWRWPPRVVRLA